MSSSALAAGLRQLRRQLAGRQSRDDSDEQLLSAFISRRDDDAFAALVRRHGPMVLQVCRRLLGHEQDAEDAFQAVFLVLACKAASLRNKGSLAGFLHGTAYRLARDARRSAARRRKHEGQASSRPPEDPADELSWREVRALLDEEIARLSEIYRSVFVLCHLEGLSRAEAAQRLGLKECTVLSRLAKARKQLAQRLARRGVELTAVLAATAVATPPASAVPAGLLASTIKTTLALASGEKLAGIVSASVAQLVKSATTAMVASKAKIAVVLLLTASMMAGASAWAYRGLAAYALMPSARPAEPPAAKTDDKPKAASTKREAVKTEEIQGRVLDPDGKPKTGARLLLLSSKDKITPLGTSAEDGRFTVAVSKETMKHSDHWLIAQAEGTGIDFLDLYQFKNKKPTELRLVKDNAIRGRVVNTEGKPVRGVRVAVTKIENYRNNSLDTFRAAWIKLWAGGAGTGMDRQIYSGAGALFATTTDADGRFVLQGMGAERTLRLRLRGAGIADTSVYVANRAGLDPKPFNKVVLDRINADLKGHMNYRSSLLSGPDVTVVAEAEKIIRGVVTDADTGKGQSGIMVRLTRDSDELVQYPPEAKTDDHGRYEIHGVRKTKRYLLAVADNKETGHMPSQVWAEDTTAHQPIRADIKVKKGVVITGKIIDGATGEALPGYVMAAVLRDNSCARDYPPFSDLGMMQYESADRTDGDHAFRVVATPGPILLMGKTEGIDRAVYKYTGHDAKYPQYFTENGDGYLGYSRMAPLQGIWNKVLEIKPGVPVVKKDIVLEREKIIAEVRIQDAEGMPLVGAWAATDNPKCGASFEPHGGREESSSCSVYGNATGKPLRLVFYQPDRKLTGRLTLKGDKKQPVFVKLGPAGEIKGRLLDANGKPLADMMVELRYRDRAAKTLHFYHIRHERGPILTDATGAFACDDVIPEMAFELSFLHSKRRSEFQATSAMRVIQMKRGECRDLGTIKLKQIPKTAGE